ncbi:hypothetical protein K2173_022760 [Erythroxylum novogranatense]|uniref:Uncharacterized protein n=1 Tax=Erythroxylum novogranatense TaxID=1862640 RepID=A0AAV8SNI5_9ROSI|nr:hypothetical protein K2173_022760 [Erythroxylum novogranatense]
MADSEKLTALKKAYADIILNTAKEAAARIMMSERKAQRYQRELFAAKDEALHMLLRLKQMLDSKVNEAEMTALSQQRKIEELEAQLGEAEDIVKDLRAELRQLQDEVERMTKHQKQPLGEQIPADSDTLETEKEEKRLCFSLPATSYSPVGTCDGTMCCSDDSFYKDNNYVFNPDLASIVMKSKEPELYKNGCTQRIRALERNLLGGNGSLSGEAVGPRNQIYEEEAEENGQKCKKLTSMNNSMFGVYTCPDETKVVRADVECFQVHAVTSFHRKRKRAIRCKKRKAQFLKKFTYQGDNVTSAEDAQKDPETLLPHVFSSNTNELIVQSEPLEVEKSNSDFLRVCTNQERVNNNNLLMGELALTEKEVGCKEISECPGNKTAIETDGVLLVNSDLKKADASEALSSQRMDNKFLKYTFQRKRKKETPSSPEGGSSLDLCTFTREMDVKLSDILESQKPSLLTESPRDSRRVAQVARQLISLSEKKWR